MDQQIQEVMSAILQVVPPDLLLAFLQILSQMSPEEIQQLAQMVARAVQGGGQAPEEAMAQQQQQGDQNLYGGGGY